MPNQNDFVQDYSRGSCTLYSSSLHTEQSASYFIFGTLLMQRCQEVNISANNQTRMQFRFLMLRHCPCTFHEIKLFDNLWFYGKKNAFQLSLCMFLQS